MFFRGINRAISVKNSTKNRMLPLPFKNNISSFSFQVFEFRSCVGSLDIPLKTPEVLVIHFPKTSVSKSFGGKLSEIASLHVQRSTLLLQHLMKNNFSTHHDNMCSCINVVCQIKTWCVSMHPSNVFLHENSVFSC